MKLTFIGAAHEVTGSCTLIEVGDKKGLVDCGMEQGKDLFVNQPLPVNAAQLDFVLLTHAHVDHSGRLPLLYKQGFTGSVYATAATCSLCEIMLRDCAHIQMSDAEWKSRKSLRNGGPEIEPLYDLDDAEGILKRFIPCGYGERVQLNESVTIRMTDVGHLLGSAAIEVWLREGEKSRKICFSGDVGNVDQPILKDPNFVSDAEYLVIESTYGDRNHITERLDYVPALAQRIQRTLDRGGNLVIPSFAVGRTQEMLYFIREIKEKGLVKGHGEFPVYVDSPMAIEATKVFLQCDTEYLDEQMREVIRSGINPLVFENLHLAVSQEESKAINEDKTPKVIISASGMCDAGRIRHHLKHNLWRPECTVLFVGYQSVGTLGRSLVDGAEKVKLFGESIQVEAAIDVLPGVSGHADKNGLLRWLQGMEKKPELVFVNHGDPESADSFTACLSTELGYKAVAPYSGSAFDLLSGECVYEAQPKPVEKTVSAPGGKTRRVSADFTALVAAAQRLLRVCNAIEGRSNRELQEYGTAINKLCDRMEN